MRNLNGIRVVLLLIPVLFILLPIGVITLVLERISSALILTQTTRDWRSGSYDITVYGTNTTGANDFTNKDIGLRINQAPTLAILGICILVYIVSAIGIFGIWELRRFEGTSKHQRIWCWVIFFSNLIMIGASAGVLGWASALQGSEKGWQSYEDVGKDDQEFTRETWACQIDKFYSDQSWAGAACGTSRATRLLLIGVAISSALVLVSLWLLVRDRGGMKWVFGGKGRYGGFQNVYELRPSSPGAQPVIQPGPQWVSQPAQWPVQPVYYQWTQQPPQPWPNQAYQPGVQPVADQSQAPVAKFR
ncbi:hypothetical protein EK21DRAFT_72131 [Setomelanomma holmii]|uniref:Uncharacterized protein n=1 Tax=Setomelanomma holmii TaxID=210430 RepID=A0A9P4H490_9PLEO|nr:hypothetical protein EK21DRAFT_72131 [Setomelanomma holmii]